MHWQVVRLLLSKGAHFRASLHYAAATGQKAVIEELLSAGMEVDHCTLAFTRSFTPLYVAIAYRQLSVAKLLLQHAADPELATRPQDSEATKLLTSLQAGGEPSDKRTGRELLQADFSSRSDFLRVQAHVRADGVTADNVMEGWPKDHTDKPLSADIKDQLGCTGLMHAAVTDNADVACKLLKAGADHTLTNRSGFSALLYMAWHDSRHFRAALEKQCGSSAVQLPAADRAGLEALKEAFQGTHEASKSILERGSDKYRISHFGAEEYPEEERGWYATTGSREEVLQTAL